MVFLLKCLFSHYDWIQRFKKPGTGFGNKMEVCRACLASAKNMMPLSETFISGYNLLTNLNIKHLDGMPQCACQTCVKAVNFFIEFREQCIQSESSLQKQLLKNIKCEPEECDYTQDSQELSSGKCDGTEKIVSLIKRPQEGLRNAVAASETKKKRCGRPRKNNTIIPEVLKTVNASFEINPNSEKLSLSQFNNNVGKDFIKDEIKYEYEYLDEIFDDDLYLDGNSEALVIEANISDSLPAKCKPNVPKPPDKQTRKWSKTTKNLAVNETAFPCGLCEKLFETRQLVSNHLEEHIKDSKCRSCETTFPDWQALLAHRIKHVPKKCHHCHICLKILYTVESLEYHYLLKHSNKNLQDIKLSCNLCTKKFSTLVKLRRHIGGVHSSKKYICDYCSKTCSSRNGLKVHLRKHSEVKKYVCDNCGDRFKQSTNLKTHIWRKHTATKVYCPCCHRIYPNKEALQTHVCPQTEKICPVCGKVYPRADKLHAHMASHSDVRKYKCEVCPASFKTRGSYEAHSNRHRGLRPHACSHCPKGFYSASQLSRHKRIHAGVRPYVCKVCSKAFNSNYNLKFHMRVHGQYLVAHRNKQAQGAVGDTQGEKVLVKVAVNRDDRCYLITELKSP